MQKFSVTTAYDIEMGNAPVEFEAETVSDAAEMYGPLRATDYFHNDADSHIGEKVVILVQHGLRPVEEVTTEFV